MAALLCGAAVATSRPAEADPSAADKALALALFREGRALLAAGETAKACRKLEESQRLDPDSRTLLNLAVCHEKEGLVATAWAEFEESVGHARREGREDRVKLALEHIGGLEAKLPRMVLLIPRGDEVDGLEIRRDGRIVGKAAWGTAMPVDPGAHVIDATAPGKRHWSRRVVVSRVGYIETVTVGPLLDTTPGPRGLGRRTAGWTAVGVGAVWIGVGSFLGARAFSLRHQSDGECPGGRCTISGVSLNDHAKVAADISTASFVAGALGLGLGTFLLVTGYRAERAPQAPRASFSVGPRGGAITVAF